MSNSADNALPWLAFDEFVGLLAEKSSIQPRVSEREAIWENGPYRVELALDATGLQVSYLVQNKPIWQLTTGTFLNAVDLIELDPFLNGPQPPRKPQYLPADEQRIETLQKQLHQVQQQVHRLMDHRRWHRVYTEIVTRNPELATQNNQALIHLRTIYQDYAALGVRKQVKYDKDSYSLIGVMKAVHQSAGVITRYWHHRLWRGETSSPYAGVGVGALLVSSMADEVFDTFAGSGQRIDAAVVQKDITDLEAGTRAIVDYADRMAAHQDRRGFAWDKYTQDELNLDAATLAVEAFTFRYSRLLFGLAPKEMTPLAFRASLRIFRDRWIASDEQLDDIAKALKFYS